MRYRIWIVEKYFSNILGYFFGITWGVKMSRQESYEFDKKYEYRDESPYEGAVDEGIEDAKFLYGEVSWSAEIKWNKSAKRYEAELFWTDHGNNFSDFGEGPMRDEFLDDLYTFISNKGIGYEEFELV